ncbi:indoleacetamide hydrolase, putative [Babesia ovata]|uniref:Indoleacetamide hydrolase, putative n=1 Tax=Babesia ovata TaxID=189622 RepID=A0A2H6KGH5_9APIC|nr:indoleacetamide hydrolase, putative [Babesia ovata]GBE62081.1 indoleacetamide hydrolase, putative [Babesia ovata]
MSIAISTSGWPFPTDCKSIPTVEDDCSSGLREKSGSSLTRVICEPGAAEIKSCFPEDVRGFEELEAPEWWPLALVVERDGFIPSSHAELAVCTELELRVQVSNIAKASLELVELPLSGGSTCMASLSAPDRAGEALALVPSSSLPSALTTCGLNSGCDSRTLPKACQSA